MLLFDITHFAAYFNFLMFDIDWHLIQCCIYHSMYERSGYFLILRLLLPSLTFEWLILIDSWSNAFVSGMNVGFQMWMIISRFKIPHVGLLAFIWNFCWIYLQLVSLITCCLFANVQEKHRHTRKYYATYNTLLEIKELMLKETSLLNSISSQVFVKQHRICIILHHHCFFLWIQFY